MHENERIIREFIAAWSRLDAAELTAYFTDDGIYHNMPSAPVVGRADIEERMRRFLSGWTETQWDIVNLVCDGAIVMAERMDRTRSGDKHVDLPCVGVFLMRDGQIAEWRDYFDLATYQRAMA